MKKLFLLATFLLIMLTSNAQLFIRAHNLSYGIKHEDGDIGWITKNSPENILITIFNGVITINSQKTQVFHLIYTIKEDKKIISYSCKDNENKDCVVSVMNDEDDNNFGYLIIDYNDVLYFYYTSIEK